MITGLREIGAFSNTKACKRKCQWYVICIFKTLFRQKPRFKKGDFYRSKLFNQFDRGITDTAQAENNSEIIRAGLGALAKESWGIGVTCLRAVSSRRGAHKRNCSSCAQMPLIGIS